MPDLIPGRNGGSICPPWERGSHVTQGASRKGTSWRKIRKETRAMMEPFLAENVLKLQALCSSDDDRVAVVAIKEFLDRFLGKVRDTGFAQDGAGGVRTLNHLTEEQAAEVAAALAVLQRHAGGLSEEDGE